MLDIYYIDYYDMNDGWLGFEYINECRKYWIFANFDEALKVAEDLNEKLAFGNVSCGERYEVRQASSVPLQAPESPVEA